MEHMVQQGGSMKKKTIQQKKMYIIWKGMRQRCNDKNHKDYNYYGGKGISVSKKWNNFETFFNDMQSSYDLGLQLDRIDSKKNYTKNNCRWLTSHQQNRNRSDNFNITFKNRTQCSQDWANELGITRSTITFRIENGWSIENALTKVTQKSTAKSLMKNTIKIANNSKCSKAKVGCLILDKDMKIILSTGYNNPGECSPISCKCGHAEIMAINKLKEDIKDKVFFVTMFPCLPCTIQIINSGCSKLYYHDTYKNDSKHWSKYPEVLKLLDSSNIEIIKL